MNLSRKAYVYIEDVLAGIVAENDKGYVFQYDHDYLSSDKPSPVSLTLPLRETPYFSNTLFPFFDGLIPEGWLLNIVTSNWKIDRNDRFGILLVAAKDSIGNISVHGEKAQ